MLAKPKWSHFTPEEIEYVTKHFRTMKAKVIAAKLGREAWSVYQLTGRLKLRKSIAHSTLSDNIKNKMVERYLHSLNTIEQISLEFGVSRYHMDKLIRERNLTRNRLLHIILNEKKNKAFLDSKPWTRGKLLEGFNVKCNKNGENRQHILYAYDYICFDCKKKMEPNQLQVHHDFEEMPVKVFTLCRPCHLKRHKKMGK